MVGKDKDPPRSGELVTGEKTSNVTPELEGKPEKRRGSSGDFRGSLNIHHRRRERKRKVERASKSGWLRSASH